jgi:hypothetical protein
MHHGIGSLDKLIDAATFGQITTDPDDSIGIARRSRRTGQRADYKPVTGKLFQQVGADKPGRAGDRDTKRSTQRHGVRLRRDQELLPTVVVDARSVLSSDAAYMRRACEREGFPDEVRGNA